MHPVESYPFSVSIIVPVYHSSAFLHHLIEAIEVEREKNSWDRLEVVLVDDGSKDNSYQVILELGERYSYIKGIKLSKNFGHQVAVKTGLEYSTGEFVAIIDDDMQDPPALLPSFFKKLEEGYDVAYGVRKGRKENIFKRLAYKWFYEVLKSVSEVDIPLDSGDFCVMRRRVVDQMMLFKERNLFLRGIRAWVGFKQLGVEYERSERKEGKSGYTLKKLLKLAFDGIFSFSSVPIKLITWSGLLGFGLATTYALFILYRFFFDEIEVKGFTSLVLLFSLFSSLILLCLGIIGEYTARIYNEVRERPYHVVDKTYNFRP